MSHSGPSRGHVLEGSGRRQPRGLLQLLQLGIYLEDIPVHVRQTLFQFLLFPVDDLLQT